MIRIFIRHWWFLAARALLALTLGLMAFPLRELVTERHLAAVFLAGVQTLFGVFAITAGGATVAAALAAIREEKAWVVLLDGVTGIAAGAFVLATPDLAFATLVKVIAIWGVAMGILECIAAAHVRRHLKDEWFLLAAGVGTLLFTMVLVAGIPKSDPELLVWLTWFAFFSAAVMAALAARMRQSWKHVRAESGDSFKASA